MSQEPLVESVHTWIRPVTVDFELLKVRERAARYEKHTRGKESESYIACLDCNALLSW